MLAKILGVNVATFTMQESIEHILERIANNQKTFIITANAEIIMMAQENHEFYDIITRSADLVLPDGAGVVLAAKYLGYNMPERVAGYDLVQNLLPQAETKGLSIYFFGAAPGVAEAAAQNAVSRYPKLKIAGVRNGFFKPQDDKEIIKAINDSGADILLLALGVPKQEKFVVKYLSQLNPKVFVGVGGTFDVMAGNVKRAPEFWQKHHLEWLYRFAHQPQRFMRILALPKFVIRVLASKLLNKN